MGQYYLACNLDKGQVLDPWTFGDGAKLVEFGASGGGLMTALALLLADGNNRGSGDLRSEDPLIGSWAGDRLVITGDYADKGRFLPHGVDPGQTLYRYARDHFEDVSFKVLELMCVDPHLKEDLLLRTAWCQGAEYDRLFGEDRRRVAARLERDEAKYQLARFYPDLVLKVES